jgi:hypothetical protein
VSIPTSAKAMRRANTLGRWSTVSSICTIGITSYNSHPKICKFMAGKLIHTLVPWRQAFRHSTKNECKGWFAHTR